MQNKKIKDSVFISKKPKVSVCIVTYNQEKFIGQCLQSIVEQETDFDFEIIVGDDASQDGTRRVIQQFVENYPEVIRAVFHEKNKGPTNNYLSVHNLAKGEYIAHLDGDDYALPGKLTALANHLDSNPDCAIVWHRMRILNERGQSAAGMPITPIENILGKNKLYAKDLALYYGITGCHSGSMYRKSAKTINHADGEMLDYYFTLSMCVSGSCAMYISECLGVYRFFATEQTVTRSKGALLVGCAKLQLIDDYLKSNPELKKSFAAQCLFEALLRRYLRYPLVFDYLKMWARAGFLFRPSDFLLICRFFSRNRSSILRSRFKKTDLKISPEAKNV